MKRRTAALFLTVLLAATMSATFGSASAECSETVGLRVCHDTSPTGGVVSVRYGPLTGGVLLGADGFRGVLLDVNGSSTGAVVFCDEAVHHQIVLYGVNSQRFERFDAGIPCSVAIPV